MQNSHVIERNTSTHFENEPWADKPWKKFEKVVFRLQKRIYAARQKGNLKKVSKLQRILLKSRAAMHLAVRQVTQLNSGKKTAGVDGKVVLTERERKELVKQLMHKAKSWKPSPARRILIPKADGSQRQLGIPTIADRAWQGLMVLALEPCAEATFHANSYGFRPGRGCWDAHQLIWLRTSNTPNSTFSGQVYELDIEKCFDRINHLDLIKRVELPRPYRHLVFKALKAGVVVNFKGFEETTRGTPQGGVISPLLANICLNGIEALGRCVRYADDMIFTLRKGEDVARLQAETDNFLAVRGLNVKASKTRVADMKGGFDFLGLNFFLKPNGSSTSKPKRDWLVKTKATIRNLIKSRLPQDELKRKLLRITEGKRRFYQYSDLSKVNGEWWKLRQFVYASIGVVIPSLVYHRNYISVKGSKSPFDGDWIYWVQRNNRRYQGNIRFNVLKRQQGKCGLCGLYLTEVAEVHLHHLDGDHSKARIKNLQLVHRACHMNHHRTLAVTQRQSPTTISRMQ